MGEQLHSSLTSAKRQLHDASPTLPRDGLARDDLAGPAERLSQHLTTPTVAGFCALTALTPQELHG